MSNFSILEASMLCQQLPLIFGITATNSYSCAVRRRPVFFQNSTISLCSLRLSVSLFFQVAEKNKDVQLIVEIEFLAEQVEAIRKISEYFAQLRTLHKGHGLRG